MRKLSVGAVLAVAVGACSHSPGHGLDGGGGGSGPDLSVGDDLSGTVSTDMAGPLVISPLDQTVTAVVGQAAPTVQYTATVNGVGVAPQWTIDRGEIGSINVSSGLFTAAGTIGGKAMITAVFQNQTATTSITVKLSQTQNGDPGYPPPAPGAGGFGGVGGSGPAPGATGGQIGVLGGNAVLDGNVHILYPYDQTVWPRGLLAPLIAWDPSANRTFDAVMIKLHSKTFDYTGTFGANATPFMNIPIPQGVWHTLTYSNGGMGDDVTVTIVFEDTKSGTPTAIGPYTLKWHIAPGTLKGTVYYNSYGTALVLNSGEHSCAPADVTKVPPCNEGNNNRTGPYFGAATLAIRPGMTDPIVAAGTTSGVPAGSTNTGCRVCHAVSANGSSLFTQHGDNYKVSSSYALTMGYAESPVAPAQNIAFPALAPDGTWLMSGSGGMINGDTTTQAYLLGGALKSVQPTIPWTSFQAALPVFSPDGKHLAFNYQSSTVGTTTTTDGKSLAALAYDPMNQVFSGFAILDTPAAGQDSWSSFLPTNDAVVFEREIVSGSGFGFTRYGNTGELWWTTLANPMPTRLDKLNGKGYLPTYGTNHGNDAVLNYEPTVNPVVSGGYAWVVFTSRRAYGNVATLDPWTSDPRNYDWTTTANGVTPKKLWVAAIDINAPAGTDPSHPAFYLPAQELVAGNARGFWTVDPCHPDGTGCETGDECCGGYCRPGGDGGALICTMQQPMCAQEYEKCMKDSDCCGAAQGITCINGRCSKTTPIP